MAFPSASLVSWWYSSSTKLGIYFNDFGLNAAQDILTASGNNGLDSSNGMSASVQEDYRYQNIITNHPVENSLAISDHIIPMPIMITVTGLITSMVVLPVVGSYLSFSQLGNATELLVQMAYGPRSSDGISLTTGLLLGQRYARFDNLAVESLDLPRNNEYGRSSIKFSITFKQMIITQRNSTVQQASYSNAVENDTARLT